jgi:hypothetical protein
MGMGAQGQRAYELSLKGGNKTETEKLELANIIKQLRGRMDSSYLSGDLSLQNVLDTLSANLEGTSSGNLFKAAMDANVQSVNSVSEKTIKEQAKLQDVNNAGLLGEVFEKVRYFMETFFPLLKNPGIWQVLIGSVLALTGVIALLTKTMLINRMSGGKLTGDIMSGPRGSRSSTASRTGVFSRAIAPIASATSAVTAVPKSIGSGIGDMAKGAFTKAAELGKMALWIGVTLGYAVKTGITQSLDYVKNSVFGDVLKRVSNTFSSLYSAVSTPIKSISGKIAGEVKFLAGISRQLLGDFTKAGVKGLPVIGWLFAIGAVITESIDNLTNMDKIFGGKTVNISEKFSVFLASMIKTLTFGLFSNIDGMSVAFNDFFENIPRKLQWVINNGLPKMFSFIGDMIGKAFDGLVWAIKGVFGSGGIISKITNAILVGIGAIFNEIFTALGDIKRWWKGEKTESIISSLFSGIINAVSFFGKTIDKIFFSLINKVLGGIMAIPGLARAMGMKDTLNDMFISTHKKASRNIVFGEEEQKRADHIHDRMYAYYKGEQGAEKLDELGIGKLSSASSDAYNFATNATDRARLSKAGKYSQDKNSQAIIMDTIARGGELNKLNYITSGDKKYAEDRLKAEEAKKRKSDEKLSKTQKEAAIIQKEAAAKQADAAAQAAETAIAGCDTLSSITTSNPFAAPQNTSYYDAISGKDKYGNSVATPMIAKPSAPVASQIPSAATTIKPQVGSSTTPTTTTSTTSSGSTVVNTVLPSNNNSDVIAVLNEIKQNLNGVLGMMSERNTIAKAELDAQRFSSYVSDLKHKSTLSPTQFLTGA